MLYGGDELVHLGVAPLLLFGEDELPFGDHVELALGALDDLDLVLGALP